MTTNFLRFVDKKEEKKRQSILDNVVSHSFQIERIFVRRDRKQNLR